MDTSFEEPSQAAVSAVSELLGTSTSSTAVSLAIEAAQQAGFVPGIIVTHQHGLGEGEITGYNTDSSAPYPGSSYPLCITWVESGESYMYGTEEFHPPSH